MEKQQRHLERIAKAAVALLETLGTEDGYFPTAGAAITRELKNAVKAAGYKVRYGHKHEIAKGEAMKKVRRRCNGSLTILPDVNGTDLLKLSCLLGPGHKGNHSTRATMLPGKLSVFSWSKPAARTFCQKVR